MDNRIQPGSYFQYSPTGVHGSLQRSSSLPLDHERDLFPLLVLGYSCPHGLVGSYGVDPIITCWFSHFIFQMEQMGCDGDTFNMVAEFIVLLLQHQQILGRIVGREAKIGAICANSSKIMRMSGLISNQSLVDHERIGHEHPFRSLGQQANGGPMDMEGWSAMQTEENGLLQRMAPFQASRMGWHGARGIPTTTIVKKVVRLDVPVAKFPNVMLQIALVHVLSDGDEEKLKDKPGYEHLNEPLHLLVEAEFPEDIIASRLDHAVSILENLLKPVVTPLSSPHSLSPPSFPNPTSNSPLSLSSCFIYKKTLISTFPLIRPNKPISITCSTASQIQDRPSAASESQDRVFNFATGPATLFEIVLKKTKSELYNWHVSSMSVMKMSHRGKEFLSIIQKAKLDL
ncbi:hypothetical protein TEA_007007 [Camellia sinensis var. sinensis]|uniref:Uncharacterized protein n=1 Tax=Camellia sinensis var. sinensis TaxID=542762 RepID=A0A4S4DTU8_CAMSN|nr:hypothetical protein TEA_007007 [Camellia sinensis var. sinensis]